MRRRSLLAMGAAGGAAAVLGTGTSALASPAAALAVPQVISFTIWGFTDADSWVPGTFAGEGYATIYDVNQQPKPAYYELQADLELGAFGAPRRIPTPMPPA